MGFSKKLSEDVGASLLPGEEVQCWRAVSNGKITRGEHRSRLALLGPAIFACSAVGAITSDAGVPDGTNLVVMTNRRLLWCHKARGGEVGVRGSDFLSIVAGASIIPARIALAKLRVSLHGGDSVQFDLPSDHRASRFADSVNGFVEANPSFSPPMREIVTA